MSKQAKNSKQTDKPAKAKKAKAQKSAKGGEDKNERVIADNRKARPQLLGLRVAAD